MFHRTSLVLLSVSLLCSACTPAPRKLDPTPIRNVLESETLPEGVAHMAIQWDTSGDQMVPGGVMVGLRLVVHYGNVFEHQMFANCVDVGSDETGHVYCDDHHYQAVATDSAVRIVEVEDGAAVNTVTEIDLPPTVRTVEYNKGLERQFMYSERKNTVEYIQFPEGFPPEIEE